jgi:biopolymer transport protein TolR
MEDGMSMLLGAKGITAEINVTPLIDVLLTLIITFLVITPLAPRGEDALAPHPADPKSAAVAPDRTIVVQVTDSGTKIPKVQINYEDVSWEQLQARLQDIYKVRAEKVLFVRADSDIDWDFAAQVVGIAHSAGIGRVGLMTPKLATGV